MVPSIEHVAAVALPSMQCRHDHRGFTVVEQIRLPSQ